LLPDSKALGCAAAGPHFHVVRRVSNENDALGKSRRRTLPVIDEFIEDYRDYRYERSDRLPDVHSRFVFINYEGPARPELGHGRPRLAREARVSGDSWGS
jgi:integrase/recombinase XerD